MYTIKKTILLMSMALCGLFTVQAQETSSQEKTRRIDIGGGIGMNYSSLNRDTGSGLRDASNRFMGGIYGEFYKDDHWGVKIRVNYDTKGFDNTKIGATFNGPVLDNVQLDYITVPIALTYHFGAQRNWYIHGGPYVGFLLSATGENSDLDLSYDYKTNDFGIDLGMGVQLPIYNKWKFYLEWDSQIGLLNVVEDHKLGFEWIDNDVIRNHRINVNFGILFQIN